MSQVEPTINLPDLEGDQEVLPKNPDDTLPRKRTLTEKGKKFQSELIKKKLKGIQKRISQQKKLLTQLLRANNVDMINLETTNLDRRTGEVV